MKKKRQFKSLRVLREVVRKDSRILNFKRPKWKYLQSDYKRFFFNKRLLNRRFGSFFKNQSVLDSPFRIVQLRLSYKRFLMAKIRFFNFYDLKVTLRSLKRLYIKSFSIYSFLINFEYRLDILLWRLGYFSSPTVARFYISQGNVSVNSNKTKSYSYVLKRGDLVQINPSLSHLIHILLNKRKSYINPFYVESSYNTLEVIILENPLEQLISPSSYMYPRFLDLSGLRNYLNLL